MKDNENRKDWKDDEVDNLMLTFLYRMLEEKSQEGVDVSYAFAKYMARITIDPDNYPVFMKLLENHNHWVIDALVGNQDLKTFFIGSLQPNTFILSSCIEILTRYQPGELYPTVLELILNLMKVCYAGAAEGYRLYPLDTNNINQIGKHLNKEEGYQSERNRLILEILDSIASLVDIGGLPAETVEIEQLATHANNIRGKFLDPSKKLNEAIPDNILKPGDYQDNEIKPTTA
jgi:hypothetical protein